MTDLTPVASLDPVVQLETNTLALGGTGNPMNQQAQALLNRDAFRATEIAAAVAAAASAANDVVVFSQGLADDTDPMLGAALVGYMGGTVHDALISMSGSGESRTVESFGAVGDGVTNDTPALLDAFAWLQAEPGRTLKFSPATYLQGPGGVEVIYETNPYFPARFDLSATANMTIIGNGAIIEADTTLTDTQFNRGLAFFDCHNLTITDLTYDGRLDARTPFGGDAFNDGNELTGNKKSGFSFYDCHDTRLVRVYGNRTMMDGLFWGRQTELSTGNLNPSVWRCGGDQNYRQGSSLVACSYGVFIQPEFTNTGGLGVGKGTLPMAGIDIESDFDNLPCVGNVIIGGRLAGNLDGLIFSRAAQNNVAIGVQYFENRARGVSSSVVTNFTTRNTVRGGKITQTLASSETELYAAYIGGNTTRLEGVEIKVADPHRGLAFLGLAQTVNCVADNCDIEDVGANGAFNQILVHIQPASANCKVTGTRIANATGTTGWHALLESTTGVFEDNRVVSGHGALGARGVSVVAAAKCINNQGSGTNATGTSELAVFNLSGAAVTVQQLGPNIDALQPRLGGQRRRVGFTAEVINYLDAAYDAPNVPANSTVIATIAVAGAQVGDTVFTDLQVTSDLRTEGRVLSTGNVRLFLINATGADINAGATNLRIRVTAP